MRYFNRVVFLSFTMLFLGGCGDDVGERKYSGIQYLNYDALSELGDYVHDNIGDDANDNLAESLQDTDKYIKWTATVTEVTTDKKVTLKEEELPEVQIKLSHKIDKNEVEIGDIVTVSGKLDKYVHGLFGTIPLWKIEDGAIIKTTKKEKQKLIDYQQALYYAKNPEEKVKDEAKAKAESIVEAESKVKAESITEAESKVKAESIAVAESKVKAESIARAESKVKAESIARAESKAQAESEVKNTIPGLDAGSVKMNLKNDYYYEFSGPEYLSNVDEFLDTGTNYNSNCEIYEQSPSDISYVGFTVNEPDDIEYAKKFLGYCATVQYDGAEPSQAQEWVVSNLNSNLKNGDVVDTIIGGVNFHLSGGPGGFSLQVYADGVDIE